MGIHCAAERPVDLGKKTLRQKIKRDNGRIKKVEVDSMRFLKLMWIWSLGNQDLMVQAWDSEHRLEEHFCNTEILSMPLLLQKVNEHLSPEHPLYEQEAKYLSYPEPGAEQKTWFASWKFFVEWKLSKAVVEKNVTQGISVPPDWILTTHGQFLKGAEEGIPDVMAACACRWWEGMSPNAKSIWLCRWRKNWGFKHGNLQPRGYILVEEVQKKASPFQKQTIVEVSQFEPQNVLKTNFYIKSALQEAHFWRSHGAQFFNFFSKKNHKKIKKYGGRRTF